MVRARLLGRILRILGVVMIGLLMAGTVRLLQLTRLSDSSERRLRWSQAFMARLTRALPFEVSVQGQLPSQPMLWVGNHVSWTDIPVVGMLAPLAFLSKAEVRGWPVAGWLAEQAGTLFIRRGAGDSQLTRRQMTLQLQGGAPVLIYPEGTTTDGRALRTFHGRLLASALDAEVPVQPIAIRYERDGQLDPLAPFIGEDDLLSHLLRLLRAERSQVQVHLLTPISSAGKERAALAHECQLAVQQALFGVAAQEVQRQAA
ncbi:lysophospholipid acyltransferase family protein [Pseudomonas sp. HR96]|uniref:lysophospholipid acyltransferase family protein n=1 Tax=Pseudomonas sp. HR96 TaxID=1027966 RepID=UPI002A74E60C|nr:lysophospholipid acyltransferase family protein [Pseudomonas sp. HR96]WPO99140.1 lysophospholipid acyltransferase family protein [Pseudomonas sp. HR96]